jgi:hypothetical protein
MIQLEARPMAALTPNEQSVGLHKLVHNFAFHFFGPEGFDSLRGRRWAFISLVGPTWGFIADLFTVLGQLAWWGLLFSALAFSIFAAAIRLRTRYCQHCAFPCIVSFILAGSFGVIFGVQQLTDTGDIGFIRSAVARIDAKLDIANKKLEEIAARQDELEGYHGYPERTKIGVGCWRYARSLER